MKVVQDCLSVRKDLESSFHRCGGPVRIVQACLCSGVGTVAAVAALAATLFRPQINIHNL